MAQSTKFWDRIAAGYARRPVPDEAVYQKKLEITRSYFRPDMEVLEFGCGTGSTAIAQAPYVKHIRATDISAAMLAIAREKAEAAGVANVTFEQADIDALDVPDGTYDAVMGHSILHLLADKEAAIARVYRMLRPGGVFVSSTTCLGDTMWYFKLVAPVGKAIGLMPLVKVFTVQNLVESLTAAGFVIDHQWQPGKGKAVFIVAKKPG
ncbi:MAG: class I SAM-dependent methyltransferase [Hyphomicrobiales bacterium]|nr:class I SAM-dependent methyltransferase [Hyphomicrobiales bacterium]